MLKRKNHYISAFYLAGFTASGKRKDLLHVHDLDQKKSWRARPDEAGWRKDYNHVNSPGMRPDQFEDDVERNLETPAAAVIQNIIKNQALPEKESRDFRSLMAFIAYLSTSVPAVRDTFVFDESKELRELLKISANQGEEIFNYWVNRLLGVGIGLPHNFNIETATKLDDYEIHFPQNWQIQNQLRFFQQILMAGDELIDRSWSLLMPKNANDEFICSDVPVSWMNLNPKANFSEQELIRPNFGEATIALMPISRSIAIEGRLDDIPPFRKLETEQIAMLNGMTIRTALSDSHQLRYIYSPSEDFIFMGHDKVETRANLISGKFKVEMAEELRRFLSQQGD
jgi:hypothetical protein